MLDPRDLVNKLCKALDARQTAVTEAENWWSGNHPIPPPPANTAATTDADARKAFQGMAQLGVTNFLGTVANVPASKLRVEGFRFGDSPTSTDAEAWAIWQRNHMDADSDLGNLGALKTGQAFALVWVDDDQKATITVEDPSQAIVMYLAGSRRIRRAGLKRWVDDDGHVCATLYLPEFIHKYRSKSPIASGSGLVLPTGGSDWVPREVDGEAWPLPNPLGEVNLIELRIGSSLKPAPFGGGVPVFTGQINEQRKINHTVFSLLTTMDYQSFRQRWVTGWDPPVDDQGRPDKAAMQKAAASRLWTFGSGEDGAEAAKVQVGEFSQAEMQPIVSVIEAWVKVIASTSGTPPYAFLLGDMINVAADSLARIEGIHIANVTTYSRQLGEGWNDVLRLALKAESNPKWTDTTGGVVWGEFEQRTATEQGNLALMYKTAGAPLDAVFAALPGVSQQEAARWVRQANANAMVDALDTTGEAGPEGAAPPLPAVDPAIVKAQADAMGILIRSGVEPADAARLAGFTGIGFTGAVPVTLRQPKEEAAELEGSVTGG